MLPLACCMLFTTISDTQLSVEVHPASSLWHIVVVLEGGSGGMVVGVHMNCCARRGCLLSYSSLITMLACLG